MSNQILHDTAGESAAEFCAFAKDNAVYEDDETGAKLRLICLQGGDMSYLLIFFGLSSATSNYPCLFCLTHKQSFFVGLLYYDIIYVAVYS